MADTASSGSSFLIFNFVLAYAALSSRGLKNYLRIDHNVNPREDVATYGERAVREGKITESQLRMLKRNEAAHANAVENYTLLVAAILSAQVAGVNGATINRAAMTYTVARVVYGVNYLLTETRKWSWIRTAAWWIGNGSCFYLLSKAGSSIKV